MMKRAIFLVLLLIPSILAQNVTKVPVGGVDEAVWGDMFRASVIMIVGGILMLALAALLDMREYWWERKNRRLWIGVKFSIGAAGLFFTIAGMISLIVSLLAPTILG